MRLVVIAFAGKGPSLMSGGHHGQLTTLAFSDTESLPSTGETKWQLPLKSPIGVGRQARRLFAHVFGRLYDRIF